MPSALPDKRKILDALVAELTATMTQLAASAKNTREGATHPESKPENDKDTRAIEQSYLARGQAMRVEALAEEIDVLRFLPLRDFGASDPIETGALVQLEADDDGSTRLLFLTPYAGGTKLDVGGATILVVTPSSPMGMAILDRSEGDEVELRHQGRKKTYEILAVR